MLGLKYRAAAGWLLASACATAFAQGGIYTCIDAKGRKLTSDRPIPECLDRDQKELNPTGSVKRVLKPALTADEQAREDEKNKKAAEERARLADEKKRERALLARYPDRASHDHERAEALAAVHDVIAVATRRTADLQEQRRKLLSEADFYRNDRSKMPPQLKRQLEENEHNLAAQQRFMASQNEEKARVNARFDEELAKLERLWTEQWRGLAGTSAAAQGQPRQP